MPDKRLKEETLPVERYFIIDTEIRKGTLPTARKLAEKLGVTERTIYRYIARLNEIGAKIKVNSSTGGYYYEDAHYSISSLSLSKEEYMALILSQHLLYSLFEPAFSMTEISKGFNTLINRAPQCIKDKQREVQECIQIALPSMGNHSVVQLVLNSMYDKKPLYLSTNESSSFAARVIRVIYAFDTWLVLYITKQPETEQDFSLLPLETILKAETFPENTAAGIPVDYQSGRSNIGLWDINYGDAHVRYDYTPSCGENSSQKTLIIHIRTKTEDIELHYYHASDGNISLLKDSNNVRGMWKLDSASCEFDEKTFRKFDKTGKQFTLEEYIDFIFPDNIDKN